MGTPVSINGITLTIQFTRFSKLLSFLGAEKISKPISKGQRQRLKDKFKVLYMYMYVLGVIYMCTCTTCIYVM